MLVTIAAVLLILILWPIVAELYAPSKHIWLFILREVWGAFIWRFAMFVSVLITGAFGFFVTIMVLHEVENQWWGWVGVMPPLVVLCRWIWMEKEMKKAVDEYRKSNEP